MLACGCSPVFVADRNVRTPLADVAGRRCPCCRAPAGKKCAGGAAREMDAKKGSYDAFKYADVCPARLEVQGALL